MKQSIFFSLLIICSFLLSCEKDNDKNPGNVIFYTNAQAMLNCGPFDVEIYIGGSLVGIIEKPFTQEDKNIDCSYGNSDAILNLEKPEGNYEFTAKLTCSETLQYLGEFTVKQDSCSVVFIDLTYGD